jgi:predicted HTH transcriptional regulator
MLLSFENITSSILNKEICEHLHQNVELKKSWSLKHGDKLSALSNKLHQEICWLIVGVDDNGELVGKNEKWAIQNEEIISQHINNKLDPTQACMEIKTKNIDDNWVIIICIKNPGDVVYWGTEAYVSSGTTIKRMEPDEILELRLKLPGLTDYTRQEVPSEYDEELLQIFTDHVKKGGHFLETGTCPQDTLASLNIVSTQTARILFGDCPFRVVKYDSKDNPISNKTYFGLYTLLTEKFHQSIQEWTANQLSKESKPYPYHALKEALANAVAHAAYFEHNGDIILELHPTNLTISNLCMRESKYFANRWFSRSHKTINTLLMEVLRLSNNVDELGRGKNLIFAESLRYGKHPPQVVIQHAGKFDRWALNVHGGVKNKRYLKLRKRIGNIYQDDQKALIAHALVLWSDKPVKEIKKFIDDTFSEPFAEVLSSLDGPIFYHQEQDKIILNRWAKLLLDEGRDSKTLSPSEENSLRSFLKSYCLKYDDGYISPKELRRLGHMAETSSEKTLSSKLLSKWGKKGYLIKVGRGKYRFEEKMKMVRISVKDILLEKLSKSEEN